ncbi:LysE family translocator [Catenovulum sp. 2E275]|uniref:LysE family translocator n=1 Tax=Catenovulum sp. 2E275 TaxID=2980497 RepID=UPI0021D15B1F|nr:LysE family translocator [Catenovulum sp. 2E275]MCU4676556.1 LysE family translocator [Catenovulum sp. 2E275]
MASSLGISAGALVHTIIAAVGLSALIMASATAFFIVKMAGAMYLIYLGAKMLIHKSELTDTISNSATGYSTAFKQGLITNVLNPKVALFFLAFLPQFISHDSQSHLSSFMILGLTFVITSSIWGCFLAWSSAILSHKLRANPKILNYINKFTGFLLVGLGIRLLVSDKS